jgi:hypothetical protein
MKPKLIISIILSLLLFIMLDSCKKEPTPTIDIPVCQSKEICYINITHSDNLYDYGIIYYQNENNIQQHKTLCYNNSIIIGVKYHTDISLELINNSNEIGLYIYSVDNMCDTTNYIIKDNSCVLGN